MIWDVVDAMAAMWSRMSGGSAFVRMLDTSDWIDGIRLSVRAWRKFCSHSLATKNMVTLNEESYL